MDQIIQEIKKIGIVPVIAIDDEADALPLARALMDGGIYCAEVTFRTEAAAGAIAAIAANIPDMIVGAGTVLTTEQADMAKEAGAKFIVSPGLNPLVVKHCIEIGITIIPGIATPTEIETAIGLGLNVVKFFPAEALGGIEMIRAMSAPYRNIKFMPTGGINSSNLERYLAFEKVIACGGSWMVNSKLVREKRFDKIVDLSREAIKMVNKRLEENKSWQK